MGGHGGLNILPQKRWNVYNYENREKVRRDEEAAAREEQLKRDQSRRRDAEFRLERLRQARGIHRSSSSSASASAYSADSGHINLFDGLAEYSSLAGAAQEDGNGKTRDGKRFWKENAEDVDAKGSKKRRREEECPPNSKGAGARKVYAGVWIGRQGGEGALVSVETRVIAGGS